LLVAREIVVRNEEFADALAPIETDQMLDVIGRAEAGLTPLHVDDGAKRALIRAATASTRNCLSNLGTLTRVCVSSASEFDGIIARHQRIT
jgi:hypothetical protein